MKESLFTVWKRLWAGNRKSKGTFYRKTLILILFITSIPGLITGLLIYGFAAERIDHELVQLHKNQIARRAETLNQQLSNLELTISHWAYDPKFDFGLAEIDFYRDFHITRDITRTLLIMEGSMPLTGKLEFYVNGTLPALFNPNFHLMSPDSQEWSGFQDMLRDGAPVYWTLLPSKTGGSGDLELVLVHEMPGGTMEPFGLLLTRLDDEKVTSLLKALTPYEEGEAFLMRSDGTMLAATHSQERSVLLQQQLREEIGKKGKGSFSFLWEWEGHTYSVSYGQFERIGSEWIYVSAAPISAITKPVVFLSKIVVGLSAASMLLACLLSWFASRKLYSPLQRLLRVLDGGGGSSEAGGDVQDEFARIERRWRQLSLKSLDLQLELERQIPQVKQGFLYQLVQGYLVSYSENELLKRMKQLGLPAEDRRFHVMYIQLNGMTKASMSGRYGQRDEGLVTFAATNIIEELCSTRLPDSPVINFHDLSVCVLYGAQAQEAEVQTKQKLSVLGDEIIHSVSKVLKLSVTVSIGGASVSVKDVPGLLEEAKMAVSFRSWEEANQIVDASLLRGEEEGGRFQYPFAVEREVVQAMRTGRLEEAEEKLQAFLGELTFGGAKEMDVQQGVMNLLGSLEHAMMQSGFSPNQLLGPSTRYEQLSSLREPDAIQRWFADHVIAPFIREMECRSDYKLKRMIEQAMAYLELHYMRDVSLDDCAEHCGTNAFLLSRSFKQVSGKNFIDYITDLRMNKAKELLRDSQQKINEIAEQVGYQHSYFNRLFKRYEGLTPSQYRETVRRM
ncbi:AraC family transcriptional regulator [Paenibacillus turpanensis]|uniref:AraC family transcriptional regulator n=1 Tax=Paenibacillus turpanensis TaxID=2689078 RepID=UPI00140D5AB9|nr:AraC family transcriptional regulator [Paenibacillus turpanensis]